MIPKLLSLFTLTEFVFTYLFSSLVIYQVFNVCLPSLKQRKNQLFALCLGLGPISISWLLVMLLLAVPEKTDLFYVLVINVFYFIVCFLLRGELSGLWPSLSKGAWEWLGSLRTDLIALWLMLLVVTLTGLSFLLAVGLPYSENDALEYAMLAKIIYKAHSARMYPIFDGSHFGGFIAPFTHPLGYVGTYIWSYLIQGTADTFGLIKIVAPYYAFCITYLIVSLFSPGNRRFGLLAALLFISTPVFLNGVIRHQIDPLRIYTFFCFFMYLRVLAQETSPKAIIPGGVLLGFCLFSHSFNILALPIFGFIFLFFTKGKALHKLKLICWVSLIGFCFVLVRYSISYFKTGYIIHDGTGVREVPALHFYEVYEVINQIHTLGQK